MRYDIFESPLGLLVEASFELDNVCPLVHWSYGTHMAIERHDIFISYASEDKETVADPLLKALVSRGALSVWYDEIMIKPAQSIRESIDTGLRLSSCIVLILSRTYLRKRWPKRELSAAMHTGKAIFPIWHGITATHVKRLAPTLCDIKALDSSIGPQIIAEAITDLLSSDHKSFYKRSEPARKEKNLFWDMVACYVWYRIGIGSTKELDEVRNRHNLGSWLDHVEKETGVNQAFIDLARRDWYFLDNEDFVTAVICLLKERAREDDWCPPTPNRETVLATMERHKKEIADADVGLQAE
jgi:hypothetical protein